MRHRRQQSGHLNCGDFRVYHHAGVTNVIGPVNLIVCSLCLILLFFEAAFGICRGCKVYNIFNKEKAQLCPGGACELPACERSPISPAQIIIVLLFAVLVSLVAQRVYRADPQSNTPTPQTGTATPAMPIDPAEVERCKVPDFAKALGHDAKWKLHNHCPP